MAKLFAITTTATDTLKADARGHAEAVFTITNVTARPLRGMVRAMPLESTRQAWLTVTGETDRDFAAGATQQFSVNFDGVDAPTGRYPFKLSVASAMNPDEDFTEGPTVTVEVAAPRPNGSVPPSRPMWWIIPVAAVVLLGIIIGAWLLLRTKKVEVPNVVGKPVADATTILTNGKLKGNVVATRVTGNVSEGQVAEQSPGTGKVPEGSTVDLVVEAARPAPSPTPTQLVNVALDKNAKQSSTILNALASRAVDGNTSGHYFADNSVTHTDKTPNAWWQVDLGAVHSIAQIKIWNRTDCCPERLSNFYVLVSTAPFVSTDLNSTINQPGVSAFPAPAQAGTPSIFTVGKPGRYVRVQLVGTDWLSLAEVEVLAPGSNVSSIDRGKPQNVWIAFGDRSVPVDRPLGVVPEPASWIFLSNSKRGKLIWL